MDNLGIVREWFEIAEKDMNSAKFLQRMKPVPIEIICYHCQQSSEKYLKGFLAYNAHEIVKTHDLIILNNLCYEYNTAFKSIREQCIYLTNFGVNVRYPYPLELNETDMRLAIEKAEEIQKFVTGLLQIH